MEKPKSPPPWILRTYKPGDEAGILDLCRRVFFEQPPERFSLDYWRWEFISNSSGVAHISLADDSGKTVGHYAVVPRTIKVNEGVCSGSIVVDVMTHPDYRQQGMFTALGKYALSNSRQSGIEFSYGFPVRKDVMPGHLKIGWEHIFDIPILARPLRFEPIVRSYLNIPVLSRLAALVADIGYQAGVRPFLKLTQPHVESDVGVTVRTVKEFDERFDSLWCKASRQFPVMGVRDAKYLDWRYTQHPYYQYRVWVAERGNQLLGYVITRTGNLLGLCAGIIVDILADPDALGVVDQLLQRVNSEFQQADNLDLIACMMTQGGPYFAALQRQGLIVTPKVFWFIIYNNNVPRQSMNLLMLPSSWYLTWGDTDVI